MELKVEVESIESVLATAEREEAEAEAHAPAVVQKVSLEQLECVTHGCPCFSIK